MFPFLRSVFHRTPVNNNNPVNINNNNAAHPGPNANANLAMEGTSSRPTAAPRPTALQTTLLAQLSSKSMSNEECFAEWEEWAKGATPGEKRNRALHFLKLTMTRNLRIDELSLEGLGLISLPEHLPPFLKKLNVCDNRLTSLPDNLPESLEWLAATQNQLTRLPESLPKSLKELFLANNQLDSLPENLPPSLGQLSVQRNRLTNLENLPSLLRELYVWENQLDHLPEHLPASLTMLDASRNRLTTLPESITTTLTSRCRVRLENNPLSDRVRNHLQLITSAPDYNGPRFYFSMAAAPQTTPVRPLEDAVSDWFGQGQDEVKATWHVIASEEGAEAFSQFLDRLRATVNYGNPQFRQSVVEWLAHLADHPDLRKETFLISVGATESCEDRISLTLNEMKKARLDADVKNGHYDNRLDDLISLARGMFRLKVLEEIAHEKVQSLHLVDEIEVYLAYQVKLREALQLPLDTPDMRFYGASYVTAEDLAKAERSVKQWENEAFVQYLSTDWKPWRSVLERLNGKEYQEVNDKMSLLHEDPECLARVKARLEGTGLENDVDAERNALIDVANEMNREAWAALTRTFLEEQKLPHLLEPRWQ